MTYETHDMPMLRIILGKRIARRRELPQVRRYRTRPRPTLAALWFTCYAIATAAIIAVMVWKGVGL